MFKLRIKILLLLAGLLAAVLVLRLASLQFTYDGQLDEEHEIPLRPILANRGKIRAHSSRHGELVDLVVNEPVFELAVYYPTMDPDEWWMRRQRRRLRSELAKDDPARPDQAALQRKLDERIESFWRRIGEVTNLSSEELDRRRDRIVKLIRKRLATIREHRLEQSGSDPDLLPNWPDISQRMFHPIVTDLNGEQRLTLELALDDVEWAVVRPSTRRVFCRGRTLCHLLGRTRRTAGNLPQVFEQLDDEYLPGELEGVSGIEKAYDHMLRGRRGWAEMTDPPEVTVPREHGKDVVLTIDVDLQEFIVRRLKEQVEQLKYATGGAAVVLRLADQSILAAASYPTFDLSTLTDNWSRLSKDYKRRPLLNRAFREAYPPGSTVKPVVAQIALDLKLITPQHTFTCPGYLIPGLNAFRCWRPQGHGSLPLVEAISQSCDVYFYHLGQTIGGDRLAEQFRRFGLGSKVEGIPLPTVSGRVEAGDTPGQARNLAVGQGQFDVTPLQAAVMLSTLLTGELRAVRLMDDEDVAGASRSGYVVIRANRTVVDGMMRTVNDRAGTAWKYVHTDEVTLAGKTGSAQTDGRPVRWEVKYRDKAGTHVVTTRSLYEYLPKLREKIGRQYITTQPASSDPQRWEVRYEDTDGQIRTAITDDRREELVRKLAVKLGRPRILSWRTVERYPVLAPEDRQSEYTDRVQQLAHAWFIGYAPAERPAVVIAVVIEYGLHGGSGAGPVFKDTALACQQLGHLK